MSETGSPGVLLVDPDPVERRRLERELEARGWRVWAVADAPTALRVYADRSDEIWAAVVDLQLPGLQGGRVLAELGEMTPSLARFAMSANLTPTAAAAFRRLSTLPLFAKPVRSQDLDAALRNLAVV